MNQNSQRSFSGFTEYLSDASTRKPKRNQFLICLHRALGKKEYEEGMSWDKDGLSFILKKPTFISDKILMEEFSGMKFSSFVRQLNYYGFKKLSRRSSAKVYSHQHFQKDRNDFSKLIKRNNKIVNCEKIEEESTRITQEKPEEHCENALESMYRRINSLQAELEKIRTENSALRYCIKGLTAQTQLKSNSSQFEYSQPSMGDANTKDAAPGFYQSFFNPRTISNVYSTNTVPSADNTPFVSNEDSFMQVYQPNCKTHQPHFDGDLSLERASTWQMDSLESNPSQNYPEENNFLRPFDQQEPEKRPEEDFWTLGNGFECDF